MTTVTTTTRRAIRKTLGSQRYLSMLDKAIHFVGIAAGESAADREVHQKALGEYIKRVARDVIPEEYKKSKVEVISVAFDASRSIFLSFKMTMVHKAPRTGVVTHIVQPFELVLQMGGLRAE